MPEMTPASHYREITPWRPLSLACRLYLYALHGYLIEVTFTATWNLVASGGFDLRGHSSVWSLAIYSISCAAMEKISDLLQTRGFTLPARALTHTCWIYAWEFTTGSVLRALGWCPWDYRSFRYNISGLVTLEYAPLWFLCGVLFEVLLLPNVKKLVWLQNVEPRTTVNAPAVAASQAENGHATLSMKRE